MLSLLQIKCSCGARILGFFGTASRSHFIVEEPVMRELAKRGHEVKFNIQRSEYNKTYIQIMLSHQVTVVTSFSQLGDPLENYRYIEIPDFLNDTVLLNFTSEALQSAGKKISITKTFSVFNKMVGYSMNLMRHPKFLPLKNESFDLLVVGWFMNEYVFGLSGHFHCPSVVISPNVNLYPIRKLSGNPSSESSIPSVMLGVNPEMKFLDRIFNFLAYIVERLMFEFTFHFYALPYYNEEFPRDKYPPYEEVVKNVTLILLAQHFSGQVSEALLPNVIEVEGMHVKKEPSPLPTV